MTNYGVDEEQRHRDAIHKNIMEERRKERTSSVYVNNEPEANALPVNKLPQYPVRKGKRLEDAIIKHVSPDQKKVLDIVTKDKNGYERDETESFEKEDVTNPKHYDKVGFAIQPIEYITANELDFLEGNVIKYVSRYEHKGGVNDLLKARKYINWLIDRERDRHE
tara:strand:+ start:7327 stop:7821 length:495 start_codon:yes stop_codon:yes gene_type:complete